MFEISVSWKRIGPVIIGLVTLACFAYYLLQYPHGYDYGTHHSGHQLSNKATPPAPQAGRYINQGERFSLDLPVSWEGYRILQTEVPDYGEEIFSVSLPVEKFQGNLEAPKDLKEGVMLVGVRVVSKDYIQQERKRCTSSANAALLQRTKEATGRGETTTLTAEDSRTVDVCSSLSDPESTLSSIGTVNYLGDNARYYFYQVPLEAFDNGFKQVPAELTREIEGVYQSFQAW